MLAWNALGAGDPAFTDPDDPATRPNQIRLLFLDPHTRELHRDEAEGASSAVASRRFGTGEYPENRALAELWGQLSMDSREFARLWARRDVRLCSSGIERLHHRRCAISTCIYEVLHLPVSNGQRLLTHTAVVGSAAERAGPAGVRVGCRANGCHIPTPSSVLNLTTVGGLAAGAFSP